jgi:hypothetical protein
VRVGRVDAVTLVSLEVVVVRKQETRGAQTSLLALGHLAKFGRVNRGKPCSYCASEPYLLSTIERPLRYQSIPPYKNRSPTEAMFFYLLHTSLDDIPIHCNHVRAHKAL